MLGNRFTNRIISSDLVSVNRTHRLLGTTAFIVMATHYGMMLVYYGIDTIINPSLEGAFNQGVKLGSSAFYIVFTIWLASIVVRKKIPWDWWKRIHLLAYAVFILGMLHSTRTASYSEQVFSFIGPIRLFLLATFVLVVAVRLLWWAGLLKPRYKVVSIDDVAIGVKRIQLKPLGRAIIPGIGRFCYLQYKRFDQAHPFTAFDYIEETKELVFSIKASGDWTKRLHEELKVGQTVFVDGPYGVYTKEVPKLKKPIVMIAGGIGITPFYAWINYTDHIKHLFYGNQTTKDIAYKKDLEASETKIHHVLSNEKVKGMHEGYVSADLIEQEIGKLTDYEFYLCGPPPMMDAVSKSLIKKGVPEGSIRTEKFSL